KGALRGTAMHRAMECFDINMLVDSVNKSDDIKKEISRCTDEGLFDEEIAELLGLNKLETFYGCSLASRMADANTKGLLFKERPFVMEIAADEIGEKSSGGENVLIQGIIDAYFIEDNEIVVLDYKTDKVENEEELIGKYKLQLDLYARALKNALGLPVKQCILYSFNLGKEIYLR
nr:PD-(D/E)XK nuclease family protein [Lachnospiraceae bacterium]